MALARSDTTPSSVRARALNWLGRLEAANGNADQARPLLEESVAQARTVSDRRVLSLALRHLNMTLRTIGDQAGALRLIEEALTVSREDGCKREIAWNLSTLAANLASTGHWDAVEPLLLESIAVGRESGDITPVLDSTGMLARLYLRRGDLARGRRTIHEALALARQIDMKSHQMTTEVLVTLGDVASAEREWDSADDWYRQALSAASFLGAGGAIAHTLRRYAAMCAALGDARRAVRIFSATSLIHDFPAAKIMDLSAAEGEIIAAARRALGEDEFAVAWEGGQSITLKQATAEILTEDSK